MISQRLKALAKYVKPSDVVVDIGCDHGYLSIYLKEEKKCQKVYASDISYNALNVAKENIQKKGLDIECILSNGFENLEIPVDVAVIAGMGTSTILNILTSQKKPSRLIISTHNEPDKLRKKMQEMHYKLVDEQVVYENKHYYLIFYYEYDINREELDYYSIKFGISNNKEYYQYLVDKYELLLPKVPRNKYEELKKDCEYLKGLIEKM